MEILLLLIIALLLFIADKLNKLEKLKLKHNAKIESSQSTSLNPLFSEKDIASKRSLFEKWQQKVGYNLNLLVRTEKEEIEKHQNSGRDKSEFVPSNSLRSILINLTVALDRRDALEPYARKMIEANISILNGKTTSEVSEQFYSKIEEDRIPGENTDFLFVADDKFISPLYGEKIKKEYDEGLLERSEYWQNRWCVILEKT